MENVEKIICCDKGNNDLLTGMLAGNHRNDENPLAVAAMMNGGMNGMWNNPFIYLVWMMFAGRFFNGNGWGDGYGQGQQNIEMQNQLQAIRSQLQDNQNSGLLMDAVKGNNIAIGQLAANLNCDFNTLNNAICDVRGGIERLAGQVGFSAERVINAVNMGDCNVIQALKDCCCSTKQLVQQMGYENQLGQKDIQFTTQQGFCNLGHGLQTGLDFVNRSIERGFAASSYETQRQTCDIITAGNANTQRIIDTLNNHWSTEQANKIQDLMFELSQERQNNFLAGRIAAINGGCCNNGCGC